MEKLYRCREREGGVGEALQAEEIVGEQARRLPQSYEITSELLRDIWRGSICSVGTRGWGISF